MKNYFVLVFKLYAQGIRLMTEKVIISLFTEYFSYKDEYKKISLTLKWYWFGCVHLILFTEFHFPMIVLPTLILLQ